MVHYRAEVLAPYLRELAKNVSAEGVPTVRPLWYEFPRDLSAYDVDDQFMLGPLYLVAPVTQQGATNRTVVFPGGPEIRWQSIWDPTAIETGGTIKVIQAPIQTIPVYKRNI